MAELRSHAHDILSHNHDRDYKSLICYHVKQMGDVNVLIIRASPPCNFPTRAIRSPTGSRQLVHLVSFQEHMRLAIPRGAVGKVRFYDTLRFQFTRCDGNRFPSSPLHPRVWICAPFRSALMARPVILGYALEFSAR